MTNEYTTPYSVGELRDPQPSDERFEAEDAYTYARNTSYPDRILGIWDDETGELVAIAFDGLVYWP